MTRLTVAAVALAACAGFVHAAATAPEPEDLRPAVRCYEDGSCSNGWCDPLQQCHEHYTP